MALINTTVTYTANANVPSTYTWTLSGGGTPLSGSGSTFSVTWGNTPGNYILNVTVTSNCDGSQATFPKTVNLSNTGGNIEDVTINVNLSQADNEINYDQFPDVIIPSMFELGSGHGFPQFIEPGTGLINTLRKGFTYSNNAAAYGESRFPSTRASAFKTPDSPDLDTSQFTSAASSVANSFPNDPVLSSAKYILSAFGKQFNLVNSTAAVLVGQYYNGATSFKPNSTNCSSNSYNQISYMMYDSEIYADTGDWHRVMWNVIQGIKNSNPTIKQILFYGRWASGFLQSGQLGRYSVGDAMEFTQTEINSWLSTPSGYRWAPYRANMTKTAVDLGQYFREPLPISQSLYKKDGSGNYILVSGKRQFRTDTFTENVFNHINEYLPEPHNEIRYRYFKNTGGQTVAPSGTPPSDFDSWSTNEKEYRDPAYYKTSVEWALEGIYRLHDLMQDGLRSITYSNFNVNDISMFRPWPAERPAAVFCPNTEPITYGGNHWVRRWIGPEQLKWMYVDALFSGIYSIELWRDGTGGEYGLTNNVCPGPNNGNNLIEPQGTPLYPPIAYDPLNVNNFNFAEVITATVNKAAQLYTGITFDNTLKFGSFSVALQSARDKEILGKYFYQGSKLVMYLWNPWNDPTDNTSVTLYLGSVQKSILLSGRNLKIMNFDISGLTLNNDIIKIEYANIDAVTRRVTGNILNHTW